MTQYQIITDNSPETVERLKAVCAKVGSGVISDFVLVESELSLSELQAVEGVRFIEESSMAEPHYFIPVDQENPPGWGLSWISNSGGNYQNQRSGYGVDIYVIDTGVRDTHTDLAGRVETLWSFDAQPYSVTGYAPVHGTAVAGCAAGLLHGTAKNATIINLRIDFSTVSIIKACDMVLKHHLLKPDDRQSVLNFSGGSASPMIGEIFNRLTEWGIVVVASSGNDSAQYPAYPARAPYVVSVGALNEFNGPAHFTNIRAKMYGPGQNITTSSVFSDTATTIISGTSFSGPYYAGVLACLLSGSDKFNTSKQVSDFTFRMGTTIADTKRIPPFDNGGSMYPVRTMNTKGLSGVYYVNPSKSFTNEEIKQFCRDNEHQPQVIADAFREYNVSLVRAWQCFNGEYTMQQINEFLAPYNPWWFVNGQPV